MPASPAPLKPYLLPAPYRRYDVFNALDLLHNSEVVRDLKFGMGDGQLHYYLFNWRMSAIQPTDVGLILM